MGECLMNLANKTKHTQGLGSVIVPNYNHGGFLTARLNSIINQTYAEIEIIILDDASNDSSQKIIENYRAYPQVKEIIVNRENSGSTFKQWLLGLSYCQGEFIWIAESDDIASEDFLDEMVALLNSNQTARLAFCQSVEIDDTGDTIQRLPHKFEFDSLNRPLNGAQFINDHMITSNAIVNASAVLFRNSHLGEEFTQAIGFRYVGDWYVYLNLIKDSDILISDLYLNKFRSHSGTTRASRNEETWIKAFDELHAINNLLLEINAIDASKHQLKRVELDSSKAMIKNIGAFIANKLPGINNQLCIYGAGTLGQYCAEKIIEYNPGLEISFFIDQKARQSETTVSGIPVITLEQALKSEIPDIFIASMAFLDEIKEALVNAGLAEKIINITQ